MRGFKYTLIALCIVLLNFSGFGQNLSSIVEASLRKPLNLITGPATQVVDFSIEDKTYVVVIADLSFNKTVSNPFGNKNRNNKRTSKKEIEQAIKNTFKRLENTPYSKRRVIYLILFDKELFGREENRTLRRFVFKAKFNNGRLQKVECLK